MKWIMIGLVAIGVIAAFSATILIGSLRAGSGGDAGDVTDVPTGVVFVAAHDLAGMSFIDATAVAEQTVPLADIPENAVSSGFQVTGKVLVPKMVEGQIFMLADLASGQSGLPLAATLPEGGRIMVITVGPDTGVTAWLYPGCLVDVIASFRVTGVDGAAAGEIASVTALQAIRVLAIGNQSVVSSDATADEQASEVTGQKRSLVTLLVNAHEAEILRLAVGHGTISLVLRNRLDEAESTSTGVLLSDMSDMLSRFTVMTGDDLADEAMKVPEAVSTVQTDPAANTDAETSAAGDPAETLVPALPIWTTTVLRGASVEEVKFVQPESGSRDDSTDEDTR